MKKCNFQDHTLLKMVSYWDVMPVFLKILDNDMLRKRVVEGKINQVIQDDKYDLNNKTNRIHDNKNIPKAGHSVKKN